MRPTLDLSNRSLNLTRASSCKSLLQCSAPWAQQTDLFGAPPPPDWIRFSPRDRTTQQVRFMLQCLARDLTALDEPPSVYPLVVTDNAVQAEVSTCRHWTRPWMDGEVFERCLRGRDASVDAPPLPAGAHSTDWWIVRTTGSHYLNLHPYLQAACPPALKSSHGMHPRLA